MKSKGYSYPKQSSGSGQDIFEVASAAFEDANYHSFNEVFHAAWTEFQKELQDG